MKIAQIVSLKESVPPKDKNGLEFMVSYLTEELVKRGHTVTLFAPGNSQTSAKLQSIVPLGTSNCLDKEFVNMDIYRRWNIFSCCLQHKNFDIIHSHSHDLAFYFGAFFNTPIVTTFHHPSPNFWEKYDKEPQFFKGVKEIFTFLQNQKRVFVSKDQQQKSTFVENSYVAHNGIPIQEFPFNDKPQDYFLFLGFLNYEKGAHTAIQVAKKANIKLKLAGNGLPEFLTKEVYPYLNGNIKYLGPVTGIDKLNLIKNAKGTLQPIEWDEPFGMVTIESLACGTPVIGFNRGAFPEIIKDGKTGFIVKNEEEMIEAIKKIDTIDRRECRQLAEKNFTVEKMVDQYEKIYEEIIKKAKNK